MYSKNLEVLSAHFPCVARARKIYLIPRDFPQAPTFSVHVVNIVFFLQIPNNHPRDSREFVDNYIGALIDHTTKNLIPWFSKIDSFQDIEVNSCKKKLIVFQVIECNILPSNIESLTSSFQSWAQTVGQYSGKNIFYHFLNFY